MCSRIGLSLLFLVGNLIAELPVAEPIPPKFPVITVQVSVGTQRRAKEGSSYVKTMDILPKMVIQGGSTIAPIPALEATMMIVTMNTEEKYTSHKEKYTVYAKEIVPIPAAANGARRNIPFEPSQTSFDSYRDSSNVGGEVYKYYVFGLKDVASQKWVDFETNYPVLDSLCKAHPEKRDEVLNMRKGSDFKGSVK